MHDLFSIESEVSVRIAYVCGNGMNNFYVMSERKFFNEKYKMRYCNSSHDKVDDIFFLNNFHCKYSFWDDTEIIHIKMQIFVED
jgi:hypothetical protein